jgi:hypothetical protein
MSFLRKFHWWTCSLISKTVPEFCSSVWTDYDSEECQLSLIHILNEGREDLLKLNEQDTKFVKDFGSAKIQACARTVSIQNWHDLAMADQCSPPKNWTKNENCPLKASKVEGKGASCRLRSNSPTEIVILNRSSAKFGMSGGRARSLLTSSPLKWRCADSFGWLPVSVACSWRLG